MPPFHDYVWLTNFISELHGRGKQVFDSLPDSLHYYNTDGTPKTSSASLLYDQANMLLLHLQNKFLTDRVAIARGLANEQNLLDTALDIMNISLMFWIKRDQFMAYSTNFDWIVSPFSRLQMLLSKLLTGYTDLLLHSPGRRSNMRSTPPTSRTKLWSNKSPILACRCNPKDDTLQCLS